MKGGEERGSYRGVEGIVGGDRGKQREKKGMNGGGRGGRGEKREISCQTLLFGFCLGILETYLIDKTLLGKFSKAIGK